MVVVAVADLALATGAAMAVHRAVVTAERAVVVDRAEVAMDPPAVDLAEATHPAGTRVVVQAKVLGMAEASDGRLRQNLASFRRPEARSR